MAKLFSPDWLEELKSRCDIVDIVGRFVPLKKNGREFSGCCPFHHEKTPSFYVYPETQSYHCFGCKESGDVIKFVSKYDNLGFVDSVERLASMAGLPMPELKDVDQNAIAQKKKERDEIMSALREAGIYYHKNLYTKEPQAIVALNYIQKRQISQEFVRKFGLGCSLDFYGLLIYLRGKGFSDDIIKKAGLMGQGEKGAYDFFGRRLTFPIFNKDGQVIGFSARALDTDRDTVKYKNTSASPVFNKSEVIFGINLLQKAREDARKEKRNFDGFENIIIVEGQIDVISMHQFGFNNTVACLGTAITGWHARQLKQFSENVILLLDGDGAGQKATLRSIDILRGRALNVTVASMPAGFDPDELLKSQGSEAMQNILNNAIDGIEFKIKTLSEKYDLKDRMQKAKFVREALVVIKGLKDLAEQDVYLEIIRKFSGTPIDVMRIDLNNIPETEKSFWDRDEEELEKIVEQQPKVKLDGFDKADIYIIASILANKDYYQPFLADIRELKFTDSGLNDAFEYILNTLTSRQRPTVGGLYSFIDVDNGTPLLKEMIDLAHNFIPDSFPEITFESYLLKNKYRRIEAERDREQAVCSTATDIEVRNNAIKRTVDLTHELNRIKSAQDALSQKYTMKISLINKKPKR